jgi:chitinase
VISGDTVAETDETLLLQLASPVGAILLDAEGTGTIQNDDASLSIGDASLVEADGGYSELLFPVTLSTPVGFEVRVRYATGGGNASSGSDYIGTSGTLVFAPGQTSQTISVLVLGDNRNELDETFQLNLTSPVDALLADSQGIGTILDDDPLPMLSVGDASMVEGSSGTRTLSFTASLSAASGKTVTVQYTTADGSASAGSDYTSKSGTLTFLAGSTSQGVSIAVSSDALAEFDETLRLVLSNPASATLGDSEGVGTILDDDVLSIGDVAIAEGDSGAASAIFTISLAMPLSAEVRLNYATANGSASAGNDYVAASGTIIFAPGETSQTIAVPVIGDRSDEANETILLNLSSPVGVQLVDTQAVATISDDDAAPEVVVSDVTIVEGNSGTKNLSFTVSLSAASSQTVTVQYATADGTAVAGSDYIAKSGTLTFFTGSVSQTVNVTVNGDAAQEANETVLLHLLGATNAVIADDQGTGTIGNDDPLPAVMIVDAKVSEGNTGSKTLSFNVLLSAAAGASPITVNFATLAGSATAGSDFTAASGTLTFTSGQSSKYVTVTILGDALAEPDETFLVTLSGESGAEILDGEALGTITNDDTGLRISDATVAEGNQGLAELTFNVTLPAPVDFEVRVNYATANSSANAGADYVGTSGMLVFAPGQTSLPVTVLVLGDERDEADESFYVNLLSPINAFLADSQGLGSIVDDDATPTLSIADASIAEGNSGTRNLVFTVALSAISGRTITVNYATANGTAQAGSDYQARSGTLTLLAGWSAATISIPITGDAVAEGDETLLVTLSTPSGATLADSQAVGTILDDDNLSIGDVTLVEVDGGVVNAVVTVSLATTLAQEVRLDYATANVSATAGSDYLAASGTVVLAPGETTQTISVPVLGDRANEADETFVVNFSNPVNVIPGDTQAVVTIANDDPLPGLSVTSVTIVEGNAGTRSLWFTISLSEVSGRTVTVQYATADDTATAGSDYAARSGTLVFLPGWISQTFAVTVTGDSLVEGDERLFLNLFGPVNAVLDDAQGDGLILNDDQASTAQIDRVMADFGADD